MNDSAPNAFRVVLPVAEKTCESCGISFTCGGEKCWCASVRVNPEKVREIRMRFSDCLCPDCLRKLVSD
jgi:hypothetical protein